MAPGKRIEGGEAAIRPIPVGRYNFQPCPSTLSIEGAPWDDGVMFKIARF